MRRNGLTKRVDIGIIKNVQTNGALKMPIELKFYAWFKEENTMKKYECPCGYIYDPAVGDPDSGIAPGTAWEDIPEDWVCPVCGLGKDAFTEA